MTLNVHWSSVSCLETTGTAVITGLSSWYVAMKLDLPLYPTSPSWYVMRECTAQQVTVCPRHLSVRVRQWILQTGTSTNTNIFWYVLSLNMSNWYFYKYKHLSVWVLIEYFKLIQVKTSFSMCSLLNTSNIYKYKHFVIVHVLDEDQFK